MKRFQAFASLPRIEQTRGKWDLRFLDAAGQQIGTTRTFPQIAAPTIDSSWRLEGSSQYRTGLNPPFDPVPFKAVRLSDADQTLVNLVTRMADAQYPSGYYPSCADLIEVTAQLATPPSFAPQLPPTELYDPVNVCGPFTVRWYLDPKPFVVFNSDPTVTKGAGTNVNFTASLSVGTSAMLGNIAGATYQWEREIWRKTDPSVKGSAFITPSGILAWQPITLVGANAPNSGTYSEVVRLQDSISFRCTINLSGVAATNTVLDRACPTMTSFPIYARMPEPQGTFLAANTLGDNLALLSAKTPSSLSSTQSTFSASAQEFVQMPRLHSTYTVNLLTAPNPADAQVGLRFTLPDDATTSIEIIDALQRSVLIPQEPSRLSRGNHELSLSIGLLPSGSYSVVVKAILSNGKTILERRSLMIVR
jgi:hypothetical protein